MFKSYLSMKIIDTHCHPQSSQYDNDREVVLKRALDASVGMICVGTDLQMSQKAIKLAEQYPSIWASVGLHPNDNLDEQYDQSAYEQIAHHPKVVAIGEIGLDYYRTTDTEKKRFQRERFEKQIDLAIAIEKPLIIHCRDSHLPRLGEVDQNKSEANRNEDESSAHNDMIKILKTKNKQLKMKGVIHSFTGTWTEAQQYIGLGFMIGLNGIITFARQYDETIAHMPVDNILLETDAPYLTPVPYRGTRNEPAYIWEVAEVIAKLKKMKKEDIAEVTKSNAKRLFSSID